MSNSEHIVPKEERLERPEAIDDGALLRIRQIRPVDKAAGPIIDLNLELIDWIRKYKPWYKGKGSRAPKELLSSLIDPDENEFCTKLKSFIETVKQFRPGAFPGHCEAVRMLEFTTVRVLRELKGVTNEDAIFTEAIKRVGNMSATLSDPSNEDLSEHDLYQRINTRLAQIVESFSDIAILLRKRERERDLEFTFRKLPPEPVTKADLGELKTVAETTERKVDIVLAKQEETRKAVNRIDKRDKQAKKNARRRFSVETQEIVFGYWERGRQNPTLKFEAGKHRVKHDQVFEYYKSELKALGTKTVSCFKACLRTRRDRIYNARKTA